MAGFYRLSLNDNWEPNNEAEANSGSSSKRCVLKVLVLKEVVLNHLFWISLSFDESKRCSAPSGELEEEPAYFPFWALLLLSSLRRFTVKTLLPSGKITWLMSFLTTSLKCLNLKTTGFLSRFTTVILFTWCLVMAILWSSASSHSF